MAVRSPFELPIGQNYSQDRLENILKRVGRTGGFLCENIFEPGMLPVRYMFEACFLLSLPVRIPQARNLVLERFRPLVRHPGAIVP